MNQNLNDVLKSRQMKEAMKLLEESGIKTVFDATENLSGQTDEKEKSYHNLQPSYEEFLQEEFENLTIIEAKREVSFIIGFSSKILNVTLKFSFRRSKQA